MLELPFVLPVVENQNPVWRHPPLELWGARAKRTVNRYLACLSRHPVQKLCNNRDSFRLGCIVFAEKHSESVFMLCSLRILIDPYFFRSKRSNETSSSPIPARGWMTIWLYYHYTPYILLLYSAHIYVLYHIRFLPKGNLVYTLYIHMLYVQHTFPTEREPCIYIYI